MARQINRDDVEEATQDDATGHNYHPDNLQAEGLFRQNVREALDLDPFTRDAAILDEIRRLRGQEQRLKQLLNPTA